MLKLNPRTALAFLHDVVVAAATWIIAFGLRFNLDVPQYYLAIMLESLVWVVALQASIFWIFGLYRGLWRYASLPETHSIGGDRRRIGAARAVSDAANVGSPLGADFRSDPARHDHGRQPLRLPRMEGTGFQRHYPG
jgi:hypothetical protein